MTEDVRGFIQKLRQKACADCVFYVNDWCRHLKKDSHCEDNTEHEAADMIEQLTAELEQVKRERDAAVNDIPKDCGNCRKNFSNRTHQQCEKWPCGKCCGWQWRGPCAENGGVE